MNELNIIINNEDYLFIKDYKDNPNYRHGLNVLTKKTYGFDFEAWYQLGYWGDKYIPFSLIHKDQLVANVSASRNNFLINGELKSTIQIGTVMTDEAYRRKGLSRILMELVLKEFEDYELIYLYGNDTVKEFYPRFGFVADQEYVHSKEFTRRDKKFEFRKLDMFEKTDKELLYRLIINTLPVSKVSLVDNIGLDMFYLTSFLSEDIYYCQSLNLAAVAEYKEDGLVLLDMFCDHEFDLEEVISSLMNKDKMKVTLGFTPRDTTTYHCEILKEEDSTFFIRGKKLFDEGRFPVLSHA